MTRIKDTSVEAVKSATEILPLVEDFVRLRKTGGTYKGICPFHDEKSPSLSVSPARGLFHCFGCSAGGDVIRFIERIEHLSFTDAVENLAVLVCERCGRVPRRSQLRDTKADLAFERRVQTGEALTSLSDGRRVPDSLPLP